MIARADTHLLYLDKYIVWHEGAVTLDERRAASIRLQKILHKADEESLRRHVAQSPNTSEDAFKILKTFKERLRQDPAFLRHYGETIGVAHAVLDSMRSISAIDIGTFMGVLRDNGDDSITVRTAFNYRQYLHPQPVDMQRKGLLGSQIYAMRYGAANHANAHAVTTIFNYLGVGADKLTALAPDHFDQYVQQRREDLQADPATRGRLYLLEAFATLDLKSAREIVCRYFLNSFPENESPEKTASMQRLAIEAVHTSAMRVAARGSDAYALKQMGITDPAKIMKQQQESNLQRARKIKTGNATLHRNIGIRTGSALFNAAAGGMILLAAATAAYPKETAPVWKMISHMVSRP